MLSSLYIRDYALIDELDVEFAVGLNVITGETGAGKSILIGALKLLLGDRAQSDAIRTGSTKAIVEGVFDATDVDGARRVLAEEDFDLEERILVRREVSDGKSRAFVNDSPASVQQLRALGDALVDLHGQHEHQSLLRPDVHLNLLDAFGGLEELVETYRDNRRTAADLIRRREDLERRKDELARQKEELGFRIAEIDEVSPVEGEEEELDAERRVLQNAERLYTAAMSLYEALYEVDESVHDRLAAARDELEDLSRIDTRFEELEREISSARVSVSETAMALQDYASNIEFNPKRLERIQERLIALDRLKHRYGGTISEVLAHREEIGERHAEAVDLVGTLSRLDSEISEACRRLSEMALELSAGRREVATRLERDILAELGALGMPDARFEVSFERVSDDKGWITDPELPTSGNYAALADGMERVSYLISANPGEEPRPLARIASGGEISRIMLALKSILARSDSLPILVFDEIDSGISGNMARLVGERLHRLARFHQVIAITHLPQIAALADAHFRVWKSTNGERTATSILRLTGADREREIASLISGERVTEAALTSARELIGVRSVPAEG